MLCWLILTPAGVGAASDKNETFQLISLSGLIAEPQPQNGREALIQS